MNKSFKNLSCLLLAIICLSIKVKSTILKTTMSNSIVFTPIPDNYGLNKDKLNNIQFSGVSKVSLAGNYVIDISGLESVASSIDASRIGFRGCNINSFSYEAYSNETFKVTSHISSTRVFCPNDQDVKYINAFLACTNFKRTGSTIILRQENKDLIKLNPSTSTSKAGTSSSSESGNPIISASVLSLNTENVPLASAEVPTEAILASSTVRSSLAGNYTGNFEYLPILNVSISDESLNFQGCNSNSLPYEAFDDGAFRISGPVTSTERACSNDTDPSYINIFSLADEYYRSGSTITLTKNRIFLVTFRI